MCGVSTLRAMGSDPHGHEALAALLTDQESEVVSTWMSRVASRIEQRSINAEELENSMRTFLRAVARRLGTGRTSSAPAAEEHGAQRFEIGYSLASMLTEYGILLDVVADVARERELELAPEAYLSLARQLVAGSGEAVLSFVEREREERERLAQRHVNFIAHELRNPLQNLGVALGAWDEGFDPEQLRPTIEGAVARLRELVDGRLIRAQRLAAGSPERHPTDFDFVALVHEIVEQAQPFAVARDIDLERELPSELAVFQDRSLCWSVLNNTVRNGIKFSRRGGRVNVVVRPVGATVVVDVEDSCGGLAEGVAERMFAPFTQLDENRSGFGLGLAIARQAAEAVGGGLEVCGLEKGCRFSAVFPLVLDASRS